MSSHRDAITDLLFTYAERIDAGDFAGVGALFADAEITFEGFGETRRGHQAVQALYESTTRRYEDGTPRTKHLTSNVIVNIADDECTATSRSYFTVLQALPDALALQPIISGRYHDTFARSNDSWHFTRRHMLVDLTGDLRQHLRHRQVD